MTPSGVTSYVSQAKRGYAALSMLRSETHLEREVLEQGPVKQRLDNFGH
jgi:hypothetical protein